MGFERSGSTAVEVGSAVAGAVEAVEAVDASDFGLDGFRLIEFDTGTQFYLSVLMHLENALLRDGIDRKLLAEFKGSDMDLTWSDGGTSFTANLRPYPHEPSNMMVHMVTRCDGTEGSGPLTRTVFVETSDDAGVEIAAFFKESLLVSAIRS